MTVLYTVFDKFEDNEDMKAMRTLEWGIALASNKAEVMTQCTTQYFDVLIFDTRIEKFEWKDTIKEIRNKQIFTPILVITNGETKEAKTAGLLEGADMCLYYPYDADELILRVRTLKRRNTNYQSRTIDYEGIHLNRPDGKISYQDTSLSIGPIEMDLFRLLTRASEPMHVRKLSEKIGETEDKIIFFAKCLQKKIGLLRCPIKLEIKNQKLMLVQK